MSIRNTLLDARDDLAGAWLDRILATFPEQAARFFAKSGDRLQNPIGYTFAQETRRLVDVLLENDGGVDRYSAPLEKLIKIRAIQEVTASEAVAFVFLLKPVIRERLADMQTSPHVQHELAEIDDEIDRLALVAFDVYARCRESLFNIRVDEVKRHVSGLLRRLNRNEQPPAPPTCVRNNEESP